MSRIRADDAADRHDPARLAAAIAQAITPGAVQLEGRTQGR
jgi:hypothetical protein